MAPTTIEEQQLLAAGHTRIAGIDEAGRGCWAGPVVAAAVVLPAEIIDAPAALAGVDDSKQLTAARREMLLPTIIRHCAGYGVGVVPAHVIDTHGILNATRLAMQIALLQLPQQATALLIDAVTLHGWPCAQRALIRGDARCLSIAAASVVAKVTRDRMMGGFDRAFPQYGFGVHKGYGTAQHEAALRAHGPTAQHRRSFRPLSEYLWAGQWPDRHRAGSGTIETPDEAQGADHDD
jgi:ribonuclease HII